MASMEVFPPAEIFVIRVICVSAYTGDCLKSTQMTQIARIPVDFINVFEPALGR
jgi:hypothetical protein